MNILGRAEGGELAPETWLQTAMRRLREVLSAAHFWGPLTVCTIQTKIKTI